MLNAQKMTIRDNTYQTIPFGAKRQLDLLPGVLRLLSGPVGSLIESVKGLGNGPLQSVLEKKKAGQKVTAADIDVAPLLAGLKGDAIRAGLVGIADELDNGGKDLIFDLLRDTHRMKGRNQTDGLESCAEDFDTVFQGDLLSLVMVLAFVLKVNYAPFLPSGFGG